MFEWGIEKYGGQVSIDPPTFPQETIVVCDIETNGGDGDECELVCIGLCGDGIHCYIYFNISDDLLAHLKTIRLVTHNGKGAEFVCLKKYGIKIEQMEDDTQIMAYMSDSSKKKYGLKKLVEEQFKVTYPTYEEMISNKEIIAQVCEKSPELYVSKGHKWKEPKTLGLDKLPKEYVSAYNACDVFWTYKLWQHYRENVNAQQLNFYHTIELPTTKLLFEMERLGIGIDTNVVRRIHNETSKKRRQAKKELYKLSGKTFNLNSPKQLLPILRSFGLSIKGTDADTISPYREVPFIRELLTYRGFQKICSTYTQPLYFHAIKETDNRIHARFSQNTITGRLSSSDPINLQNQPPSVRECFRAKEGHQFVNADFSNIELRLPAHFSGEPGFLQELSRARGDLHTRTANFLFGGDINSLPEKERKEKRAKAKTCNFLLTNSGAPNRLATELGVERGEAVELYTKFWKSYPVMAQWMKEEKRLARINGGIGTYFGRWVNIPQLQLWCGRSNCEELCRIRREFCKQCFMREEAEREAISIRVQGTAGDMIKLAAIRLYQEYGLVPVVSVHDELMFEVPDKESELFTIKAIIKDTMERVVQLKVPIIVDVSHGVNWKEAKGK